MSALWEKPSIEDYWSNGLGESEQDFTEWLFNGDSHPVAGNSIELLGEIERTIGTYIWNLESEYSSTHFSADGKGRGFYKGNYSDVVFEVQFGSSKDVTNDHLGRLLVYAQIANAGVIVWITPQKINAQKNYSKAVSYIHNHSELSFHHLYIRVGKDSDDTIEYDVSNHQWSPDPTSAVESDFLRKQQTKFWLMMDEELSTNTSSSPSSKPINIFPVGHLVEAYGVNPEFGIDSKSEQVKFRVHFEGVQAESDYRSLKYGRISFVKEIPQHSDINWLDGPERKTPVLEVTRSGFSIYDQRPWGELISWLHRALRTFRSTIE